VVDVCGICQNKGVRTVTIVKSDLKFQILIFASWPGLVIRTRSFSKKIIFKKKYSIKPRNKQVQGFCTHIDHSFPILHITKTILHIVICKLLQIYFSYPIPYYHDSALHVFPLSISLDTWRLHAAHTHQYSSWLDTGYLSFCRFERWDHRIIIQDQIVFAKRSALVKAIFKFDFPKGA
jgi:hypothetical protein